MKQFWNSNAYTPINDEDSESAKFLPPSSDTSPSHDKLKSNLSKYVQWLLHILLIISYFILWINLKPTIIYKEGFDGMPIIIYVNESTVRNLTANQCAQSRRILPLSTKHCNSSTATATTPSTTVHRRQKLMLHGGDYLKVCAHDSCFYEPAAVSSLYI